MKLPGPVDEGPYPTVVEYSGYDPSNPDADQPASRLAQLLGYATVGVNLRGTGCSGGAYDYFEDAPVARRLRRDRDRRRAAVGRRAAPSAWSASRSPGITQLFVAADAAAAPRRDHAAVGDRRHLRTRCIPGGIFNNGFALGWAKDRQADARPATPRRRGPGVGAQAHRRRRRRRAATNQALRLQSPNVIARDPRATPTDRGAASDALAPETLRPRHRRAGVPRRRVAGRGDRQPLRRTCSATSRPTSP